MAHADVKQSNMGAEQEPPTFNFCVSGDVSSGNSSDDINKHVSTADELFSDGKILPLPIMHHNKTLPPLPPSQPRGEEASTVKREEMTIPVPDLPGEYYYSTNTTISASTEPIWGFRRTSSDASVVDGGRRRRRRNSTGDYHHHNIRTTTTHTPTPTGFASPSSECMSRSKSTGSSRQSSSSSSSSSSYYFGTHRGRSGGIRISPILNFPPPRNILAKGTGNKFSRVVHFLCSWNSKK